MSVTRTVVIIGSPAAESDPRGGHQAVGLAARVAHGLVQGGDHVELIGRVGADVAGDETILALSRDGIGHVAVLRDPSLATPIGAASRGIPLDAADAQLGLRYLTSFSTVLLIDPLDAALVRQVAEDSAYAGAQLIIVAADSMAGEGSLQLPAAGGGSPPPLFIPRPQDESPEFDAVLVALAATDGGAETSA